MAVHAPAPAAAAAWVSAPHDPSSGAAAPAPASPPLNRPSSPPRINPYHLIHHPDTHDPLPPLPPHLARLASGEAATDDEADSDTSDEDDEDEDDDGDDRLHFPHGRQRLLATPKSNLNGSAVPVVSLNDEVENTTTDSAATTRSPRSPRMQPTSDATPSSPAPHRIMKKVSSVFRRADNNASAAAATAAAQKSPRMIAIPTPERQRSPMMQGPPPSPPLSDDDDELDGDELDGLGPEGLGPDDELGGDDAFSVAVTEATMHTTDTAYHTPSAEMPEPQFSTGTTATAAPGGQLVPVTEAGESTHALVSTLGHPATPPTFAMSLSSHNDGTTPPLPESSIRRIPSFERAPVPPFLGLQAPRRVSNGSTSSSRAGSLSMVRSGRLAPQRERPSSPDGSSRDTALMPGDPIDDRGRASLDTRRMSIDTQATIALASPGLENSLPPSAMFNAPPIQRRNTNPTISTQIMVGRSLTQTVSIPAAHSPTTPVDPFNLPADILAQADILRRQRLEKRQKKMNLLNTTSPVSEVGVDATVLEVPEMVPARRTTTRRKETDEAKVLVGNLVGEGHRNYVLMYNMLTGIRVAVSRCQAKIKRPITDADYTARNKYTFDMLGNELTPSAKYDFKFKDYAPWVFRELRDEHFHLDPADYLLSLTAKYILSELGSPGKSGSFFYYSRDYRFIIKTISHKEHSFLRSILKDYHEHVRANPHTLLSRFYGLHRVKMPRGRKIHFVIMNNLFPPHRDIHETYDLKGSAWGREYPEDKARNNPRAVLKDINWVKRGRTLEFGPEKRALLTEQLRRDMAFLKRIHVMDYSLLVGIHNMERGNRDNLREKNLAVFQPQTAPVHRKPSAVKPHAEASNIRRAVVRADPQRILESQLPSDGSADRRHFLFYQDEGGLRATDEQNMDMDIIYYLGVIDICTPYSTSKRVEHAWKSMTENPVTISCVDPSTYGHRFLDFLMSVMRGGDPELRPQGLESRHKSTGAPVGSELDARGVIAPRPSSPFTQPVVIEEGEPLSASPLAVPESDEVDAEGRMNGYADVPLPPLPPSATGPYAAVPTALNEEDSSRQHDTVCADCGEHYRPAVVGHLKTD